MPRTALNSADLAIEQKRDIENSPEEERAEGDITIADEAMLKADYLAELAFMEEPVTIRIEPGSDENAPQHILLACNGKGCEVMLGGRWREMPGGWIPVGQQMTIKRKYLEVLARSKVDRIETVMPEMGAPDAQMSNNRIRRFTRQSNAFSVLEDKSPRGAAWLTEVVRRNM